MKGPFFLAALLIPISMTDHISVPDPPPDISIKIEATITELGTVKINLDIRHAHSVTDLILYRSTSDLGSLADIEEHLIAYPITVIQLNNGISSFADIHTAHNTRYFYRLRLEISSRHAAWSNVSTITTPNTPLGQLVQPTLWIDKGNYTLEVKDGEVPVKRYPVALGQNPNNRKLHVDFASTPEGIYTISNLQPRANPHFSHSILTNR